MARFIIRGQQKLRGEVKVSGAKNQALKVFAATLLTNEDCLISNVPNIEDVKTTIALMEDLGSKITKISKNCYKINNSQIRKSDLDQSLSCRLRTSLLFIGPLLARFGQASLAQPGGCVIGKRPIDFFLDSFQCLGVRVSYHKDRYYFKLAKPRLMAAKFVFRQISHTATESLILAAVLAKGRTEIINAAMEPEVVALAEVLNQSGAKISGIRSPYLVIEGVKKIKGFKCEVIADRIEAGSYLALAAATKSHLIIRNCNPEHLQVPLKVFSQIGVKMQVGKSSLEILPSNALRPTKIATHEYPGFPTDLQPPLTVLLTQTQGMSMIHETIYEGRLFYIDILNKMGADIVLCDPHRVIINGPSKLIAKKIQSPDIRAGMALIIAALIAQGQSEIEHIELIDRGYERIEEKLGKLGADIIRVE